MPDHCQFAVIWDVDGTLVDTAELHFEAWQALCREIGRPFSREEFTATFGRRNQEIVGQLLGASLTAAEIEEIGHRKEELYRAEASKGIGLLPGVRVLLEGLRHECIPQGIGSSAPRANLDLILRLTGTQDYFDAVIAQEDTTRGKPDPQVFLLVAERLGMPPERCVVLEDAVAGVQAAKSGGMKCIAVSFVGHHSEEALMQAGADLVVPTLIAVTPGAIGYVVEGEQQ